MKPIVPSTCEVNSVLNAVSNGMRLEGRELLDHRETVIQFGHKYGTCQVQLGNTRALASVRAEMVAPRPARPTEGTMQIQVDITPTAAPGATRSQELSVSLQRLLERCIRESRCVDVESLCIVADEKVWQLQLHVELLDLAGNASDAAALAALAALCHFRRPHVAVTGGEVRVCPPEEVDPVPLAVLHTPLLVTFAFFGDGEHMVADPTEVEERAMEGRLTVGINSYREICTLHLTGKLLVNKEQVLRCTELAAARVKQLAVRLRRALAADSAARRAGSVPGLAQVPAETVATAAAAVRLSGAVRPCSLTAERVAQMEEEVDRQLSFLRHQSAVGTVGDGGASHWPDDEEEVWPPFGDAPPGVKKEEPGVKKEEPDAGSESEEEQTMLGTGDLEPGAGDPSGSVRLRCPMPAQ